MSPAMPSAKPRILRPWQTAILVILVLITAGFIYSNTRTRAQVRVTHPEYADVESTVATTGAVVPVQDFPARANFSGLVERIYVHLGEKVRRGQPLLQMKDQYAIPRLEKARADLDEAEVNEQNVLNNGSQEDRMASSVDLEKATTEQQQAAASLATLQRLEKRGDVSPAEVEAAQERLAIANASLKALQQKIHHRYSPSDIASWKARVAADKASVAAEQISYGNANITSPISGTVYILPVEPWDFVPAGTDLLHVADLSKVHVRADFEEPDIPKLHIGAPVEITWDGMPGRVWHGHIEQRPLAVNAAAGRRGGRSLITIDDDNGQLPVNTEVAVSVIVEKHAHVLTIPREALYTDGGKQYVYRVNGEKLEKVPVRAGLAGPMRIEIISGLTPADTVVSHAMDDHGLRDGLKVEIVK
ncbi:MAG: efflux RND transporter periplasmic adaptor subunit [Acidobacteriota bacterium]